MDTSLLQEARVRVGTSCKLGGRDMTNTARPQGPQPVDCQWSSRWAALCPKMFVLRAWWRVQVDVEGKGICSSCSWWGHVGQ